ncbi:MAG: type II toxin-antitoxin system RelE/ParE family toxin [Methanotrichaceae archaeon]|nr:type II toxin-antitoxin system RelE/ParE family toxin [Methanotrichaceae archaeon]
MKIERTPEFKDQYRKLTRKNKPLKDKLDKKIGQIIRNPGLGEPKRYDLKHTRGAHVDPFVILYLLISDTILLLYVDHHKCVYNDAPKILGNIEIDFPVLWAVMPSDLKNQFST